MSLSIRVPHGAIGGPESDPCSASCGEERAPDVKRGPDRPPVESILRRRGSHWRPRPRPQGPTPAGSHFEDSLPQQAGLTGGPGVRRGRSPGWVPPLSLRNHSTVF